MVPPNHPILIGFFHYKTYKPSILGEKTLFLEKGSSIGKIVLLSQAVRAQRFGTGETAAFNGNGEGLGANGSG